VLDALSVVDAMFNGIDVEETLTLAATVEFVVSLEVVEYSVEGGPECELSDVSTVLVRSRDFDDTRDPVLFSGVGSPAFEDEEVSVTQMGGVIVVPVPSCTVEVVGPDTKLLLFAGMGNGAELSGDTVLSSGPIFSCAPPRKTCNKIRAYVVFLKGVFMLKRKEWKSEVRVMQL
jgi:hypothetical protein